ncbi:MAG: serine hydrolase [Armatimonadetes bacterium]|nr:serine hydrolase [Armatimonadota bacterium]
MSDRDVSKELADLLIVGVEGGVFPGAGCAVGTAKETFFAHAGRHMYSEESVAIDDQTVWDLASLTKIAATTSVAMLLYQDGVLDLDSHVQSVLPGFVGDGKDEVTVRNLLLHDSGLPPYRRFGDLTDPDDVLQELLKTPLDAAPGEKTAYSDLGAVTLMEVMQRLTGHTLDKLFQDLVADPLGMESAVYNPILEVRSLCAPTEKLEEWRLLIEDEREFVRVQDDYIQGGVHDPTAFLLGGVSGNAGLFSRTADLVLLARAWLVGSDPFSREVAELFSKKQSEESTRALGFDTRVEEGSSAGEKFSSSSFGHTGYTGTTIWIDPEQELFAILLTNRVHPTSENIKIRKYRPTFHDRVVELLASK